MMDFETAGNASQFDLEDRFGHHEKLEYIHNIFRRDATISMDRNSNILTVYTGYNLRLSEIGYLLTQLLPKIGIEPLVDFKRIWEGPTNTMYFAFKDSETMVMAVLVL
jgi:hypothetical protein